MNKQQIMFMVVGIANTAIDFFVLNLFTAVFGVDRIIANIISVTAAIIFSYYANYHLVFNSKKQSTQQAVRFLGVTLTTAYLIQTFVIWLLTSAWLWPLDVLQQIVDGLSLNVSEGFVVTNGAKLAAIAFAAVCNFLAYKYFVFSDSGNEE